MTNGFENDKIQVIIGENGNRSHFCNSCFERKVTHGKFAKTWLPLCQKEGGGYTYMYDAKRGRQNNFKEKLSAPMADIDISVLRFQY